MKITLKDVVNGVLNEKFGNNRTHNTLPLTNFEIKWNIENEQSKFLHLILIDYDAIPVCGKPWIHWTVANVDLEKYKMLAEGCSTLDSTLTQGMTSLGFEHNFSIHDEIANKYIGPMPPDKTHTYTLLIWTTNTKLNVNNKYYFNELYKELSNTKIFEQSKIDFKYLK